MSRLGGNLCRPYRCVGKNGNYALFLIATDTFTLSCACCSLGSLGNNLPCTVGVSLGLGKSNLYCSVKLGGVGLLTLCDVSRLGGNLCRPYGSICKSRYAYVFGCTALTSLSCLTLRCLGRIYGQGISPFVRNYSQLEFYRSVQ